MEQTNSSVHDDVEILRHRSNYYSQVQIFPNNSPPQPPAPLQHYYDGIWRLQHNEMQCNFDAASNYHRQMAAECRRLDLLNYLDIVIFSYFKVYIYIWKYKYLEYIISITQTWTCDWQSDLISLHINQGWKDWKLLSEIVANVMAAFVAWTLLESWIV